MQTRTGHGRSEKTGCPGARTRGAGATTGREGAGAACARREGGLYSAVAGALVRERLGCGRGSWERGGQRMGKREGRGTRRWPWPACSARLSLAQLRAAVPVLLLAVSAHTPISLTHTRPIAARAAAHPIGPDVGGSTVHAPPPIHPPLSLLLVYDTSRQARYTRTPDYVAILGAKCPEKIWLRPPSGAVCPDIQTSTKGSTHVQGGRCRQLTQWDLWS
ncbi:hypothetical protein C8Q78DRAFT_331068 [Trametes maxima]|nr:hypothetical protein C8Q78DRAFT_331068 [Trametes maxima]